jgi:predicted amidohydrolase
MITIAIIIALHLIVSQALWAIEGAKQRIITVSAICLLDDTEIKAQNVLDMIEESARRQHHDLIVTPLMPFLSFREGNEAQELKEFVYIAKSYKTYLAIAMVERSQNGQTYHTSILLSRDGEIAGKYRKTHALPDDTMALGDDLPVFQTDFGVLGFSLSTDFYFPEVYNVERMKGAEILIWQHYPERFREHFQWLPILKARALDSHAHIVTAMYADPRCYITNRYEMGMQGAAWGRSMIINRVGTPIADTGYEDGIATAILDLDKRKADPYAPYCESENIFFCNSLGNRKAFYPIAEPWEKPKLPQFEKRKARIVVGYFGPRDMWRNDNISEAMFRVLDKAAKYQPDIVLLSEMGARVSNETTQKVASMVAERARQMNSYILIGGVDDKNHRSHAWLWDRKGDVVFKEPIYWTEGFPEFQVYDTDFARIGVHLCGDLYTGEIDRVLALKGAEIIFDPSQHWGADGYNNTEMLRARAIDNGCWVACAHWNSSDPGLRSLIIDPYGHIMAASQFQQEGAIYTDIDFVQQKVYYSGRKSQQPKRGEGGIPSYFSEDIPEQSYGWRDMIFSRRRPELYGIIPTENEVIMKYRPSNVNQ